MSTNLSDAIANQLVEIYKADGRSMQDIINDTVFKSLPIEQQVRVIEAKGPDISKGSKPPSLRNTILRSMGGGLIAGGLAGGAAVMAQGTLFGKTVMALPTIIGSTIVGGLAGAYKGKKNQENYDTTNRYLSRIGSSSNKLENTLRAILSKRDYASPNTESIRDKAIGFGTARSQAWTSSQLETDAVIQRLKNNSGY